MSTSQKDRKYFLCNLLLALIVFVVPIIVRVKMFNLTGNALKFWKGNTTYGDFFSYYKSIWLISLSSLLIISFVFYIIIKKISFKNFPLLYIPLAVYLVFAFLSFSYSEYRDIALFGFPERYEGFFVIFAYVTICFIASYTVSSTSDLRLIFGFLLGSMLIVSAIGISQFFSHDFFQTTFGRQIIAPSITGLDFKFPDKYIYSTMYNPNFVGTYFSMLVPVCLALFLLSDKLKWKLTFAFLGVISLFTLIGSRSSTGYIATAAVCLFILVFLRRQILKHWILVVLMLVALVGSTYYINNKYDNIVMNEINNVLQEMKPTEINNSSNFTPGVLTDIDVNNNTTTLSFGNEFLKISFDPAAKQLTFEDTKGNSLQTVQSTDDNNLITFSDQNYAGVSLKINNQAIKIQTAGTSFYLCITPDSGFKCISPSGQVIDFVKPRHYGFEGYETWGSMRGYIWSRSIPMLKDTILLGHGPDTFAIYFPQSDLSGKLKHMNDINILVDKPHSIYLQLGLNTGLISLIAFLTFILFYLVQCFRLYFLKPDNNSYYHFGVTCMFAVVGFCVAGIANDSVVSVSPVFWVLLGVGIACNRLYKQSIIPEKIDVKVNPKKAVKVKK